MYTRVRQQEPEESHGQANCPDHKGQHRDEGRVVALLHADVGNRVRRARRYRRPDELNGAFGGHRSLLYYFRMQPRANHDCPGKGLSFAVLDRRKIRIEPLVQRGLESVRRDGKHPQTAGVRRGRLAICVGVVNVVVTAVQQVQYFDRNAPGLVDLIAGFRVEQNRFAGADKLRPRSNRAGRNSAAEGSTRIRSNHAR